MKREIFRNVMLVGLVLAVGATGCQGKKLSRGITPIRPAAAVQPPPEPGPKPPISTPPPPAPAPAPGPTVVPPGPPTAPDTGPKTVQLPNTTGGMPTASLEEFEGMLKDTNQFKAQTVYFDYDRSALKPSETAKAEAVANFLKDKPDNKVLVEGHCDERGTEEYNRSLGERRALSVREHLTLLGIAPERIRTLTWGEDRPADTNHNEEAWAKNRRGEFYLLLPKK
jgi:peptidoglycan-associated lipoprotein